MAELRAALLQRAAPMIEQAATAVGVVLQAGETVITKINAKIDTDIGRLHNEQQTAQINGDNAAVESAERQLALLRQRQSCTPAERLRGAAAALLDELERVLKSVKDWHPVWVTHDGLWSDYRGCGTGPRWRRRSAARSAATPAACSTVCRSTASCAVIALRDTNICLIHNKAGRCPSLQCNGESDVHENRLR
jgi:hypothetical protein